MQLKRFSVLTIMAATILLAVAACNRKDNSATAVQADEDTGYADDYARVDNVFDETDNFANEAVDLGNVQLKGGAALSSGCATVTRDTVSVPHTTTIDFGPTNCLCSDGRYRRGKIIITYSGYYKDSGSYRNISFDSYYVNDNHVLGGRTATNMGKNSSGNVYYNININGMMILNTTGDTVSHTATRIRTWTAGYTTQLISDDAFAITGSGSMTRANGKTFTTNISSPLMVSANCNWIRQGVVQITPQGASFARVLDYGNGNCDDQATITIKNRTKNITLK